MKNTETANNTIDSKTKDRIKAYIEENNLSMPKIAEAANMTYIQLWSLLNRWKTINLGDYVALCRAFKEPLEKFIKD